MRISKLQLKKLIEGIVAEQMGAREPMEISRDEYIYSARGGASTYLEDEELRHLLANTSYSGLTVVDSGSRHDVNLFTYTVDGTKALALTKEPNGTVYFKVNTSPSGTYYKL